jgi:hypothetical protein
MRWTQPSASSTRRLSAGKTSPAGVSETRRLGDAEPLRRVAEVGELPGLQAIHTLRVRAYAFARRGNSVAAVPCSMAARCSAVKTSLRARSAAIFLMAGSGVNGPSPP